MSEILSILSPINSTVVTSSSQIGELGETIAADFLTKKGYRLVLANFKVPIGRNSKGVQVSGEIDLIALDGDVLCFTEVKTRRSSGFGGPLSAVDLRKQRQITRTARIYRKVFGIRDIDFRFDVVTVLLVKNGVPKIELIKGFWNHNKFRKKAWTGDIW